MCVRALEHHHNTRAAWFLADVGPSVPRHAVLVSEEHPYATPGSSVARPVAVRGLSCYHNLLIGDRRPWEQPTQLKHIIQWRKCKQPRLLQ